MSTQTDAKQQAEPKQDMRGKHWGPKFKEGIVLREGQSIFRPCDYTKEWSARVKDILAELATLVHPLPRAPWNEPGARPCGNLQKYFYWVVQTCLLKRYVSVRCVANPQDPESFYGIKSITILDKAGFNAYQFPLPDGYAPGEKDLHLKTIQKHWRVVGFARDYSIPDKHVMRFDLGLMKHMKTQSQNSDKKTADRKRKATDAPPPAVATATPADPVAHAHLPLVVAVPIDPKKPLPSAPLVKAVPVDPKKPLPNAPIVKAVPVVPNDLDILASTALGFMNETTVTVSLESARRKYEDAVNRARMEYEDSVKRARMAYKDAGVFQPK